MLGTMMAKPEKFCQRPLDRLVFRLPISALRALSSVRPPPSALRPLPSVLRL